MNPRTEHNSTNYDRRASHMPAEHMIDQTLRHLGSATPRPGIEDRISTRLAHEQSRLHAARASHARFLGIPRFAIGAAAGALACAAIVAGSVNHSRRIQPVLPGIGAPPASGVGAAAGERPAIRPIEPSPTGRARSVRRLPEGRAVISPQSQKPAGVAVPKTPSPAQ